MHTSRRCSLCHHKWNMLDLQSRCGRFLGRDASPWCLISMLKIERPLIGPFHEVTEGWLDVTSAHLSPSRQVHAGRLVLTCLRWSKVGTTAQTYKRKSIQGCFQQRLQNATCFHVTGAKEAWKQHFSWYSAMFIFFPTVYLKESKPGVLYKRSMSALM